MLKIYEFLQKDRIDLKTPWAKFMIKLAFVILFLNNIAPNLASEDYDKIIAKTLIYITILLIIR